MLITNYGEDMLSTPSAKRTRTILDGWDVFCYDNRAQWIHRWKKITITKCSFIRSLVFISKRKLYYIWYKCLRVTDDCKKQSMCWKELDEWNFLVIFIKGGAKNMHVTKIPQRGKFEWNTEIKHKLKGIDKLENYCIIIVW